MRLVYGVVLSIVFICYSTGCAITPKYQLSEYQHLFTATSEAVKRKPIPANLEKGAFVVGKIVKLDIPDVGYDYITETAHMEHWWCDLSIYYPSVDDEGVIKVLFSGIRQPRDYEVAVGSLIIVRMRSWIPDRVVKNMFRVEYVRNLSFDWSSYRLPLTNE